MEITTGGKVTGSPLQVRKESDKANIKKNFTEGKDNGPLLPSPKRQTKGMLRETRDGVQCMATMVGKSIKSPGRPAKGRKRGSKAETNGAVDGEDVMEGDVS